MLFSTQAFGFALLFAIVAGAAVVPVGNLHKRTQAQGIVTADNFDDWNHFAQIGYSFAYIEATNGSSGTSDNFFGTYAATGNAGLLRGAFHVPSDYSESSGTVHAQNFLAYGGGSNWIDAHSLPGTLWIEVGEDCELSTGDTVQWIHDFSDFYASEMGHPPVIQVNADWWGRCTGGSTEFSANPLWLAAEPGNDEEVGPLPAGWNQYAFAHATGGPVFNGALADLQQFATEQT